MRESPGEDGAPDRSDNQLDALTGVGVPSPDATASAHRAEPADRPAFVHPMEVEFARLLDFYHIAWLYEPTSFALNWQGDQVTEMFTPDFYLPDQRLYVELTTMRQRLVTRKNRKLRKLRALHPELRVKLFYKRDIERLAQRYHLDLAS